MRRLDKVRIVMRGNLRSNVSSYEKKGTLEAGRDVFGIVYWQLRELKKDPFLRSFHMHFVSYRDKRPEK